MNNKYSDYELHLMSYQELRKLSNMLQLPANIKKKYMIPMIQAHQKGDGGTKTAIVNKIMEERKVKRLSSKRKQSKPYLMGSSTSTQQIPTDLSVSTKHEFETRFSYIARYTSKDEINSGISRIVKQEAEVSRRDRSILQQPSKATRKLATVGRTEIMLPRNHSLTTPVRLMPQYERGFPPSNEYESLSGLSNGKNHFQDMNSYNYHFHKEFSNALMPTTSQELYRNEPYWHTREIYNNSLMPILSSLLTPNPVTINSTGYASQYSSTTTKALPSFQGVYEKYIKSGTVVENQSFQSGSSNSSAVILNNHFPNDNNNNSYSRGSYLITKNDVDFDITSAVNDINCQHYSRRDETLIRSANGNQAGLVDLYLPRNEETGLNSQIGQHTTNLKDLPPYGNGCFRSEEKGMAISNRSFETSAVVTYNRTEISETDGSDREAVPSMAVLNDYETNYETSKLWAETPNGDKKLNNGEKDNFMDGFLSDHGQGSFMSESSTDFSVEMDLSEKLGSTESKENLSCLHSNFPRCRYLLGHSKYPESVSKSNKTASTLPFFWTTFCTNAVYNKAYSLCKNSFTGTTETHLNPIMTCTYSTQFASHTNSQQTLINNTGSGNHIQRQLVYSYPESQAPYSLESTTYTTWDEYSDDMDNKIVTNNNGHEVQVVKCRKHGCHYLYSISNPCD